MKARYLLYVAPLLFSSFTSNIVYSAPIAIEAYEHKRVADIRVKIENLPSGSHFNQEQILSKLSTKVGDPFSQSTFDSDLKMLSEEYEKADPVLGIRNGELYITLKLWQKPIIRSIKIEGHGRVKTTTLKKELGVEVDTPFTRDEFNKGFNKLKEFYIKKGYFESQLQYTIVPVPEKNEVDIIIYVHEGRAGHVQDLSFEGFTSREQSEILEMIHTKKYNLFVSWLTGRGIYHEEALEHDKLIIVDYLQNQGYADARVSIYITDDESGVKIVVKAQKGELFHFGNVSFSGNTLFTNEEIEKTLLIHKGDVFSPDMLRKTIQEIKDLYGKKGYIEADVDYSVDLDATSPIYNVSFVIEENEQFRVGMIRILGNTQTNTSVILHESLLVPGEVFDSRKLKATQQRLEAIGYFKTVNVYAVRTPGDESLGPNYRDVVIEVDETSTGNISLFFGFSSTDSIYGGLDLAESNFNYKGLGSFWKDGLSALRGGGEYAHARASFGSRQSNYSISWLTPYFRDTLWRFGFDANYARSQLTSDEYSVDTLGASVFANYPVTPYWTYGLRYRIRNAIIHVDSNAGAEAISQEKNSGLVMGLISSLNYDSTDSAYKPHRGFRSSLEAELAGVRRHAQDDKMFPFARFAFLNNYYYPVWRKGTLKTKIETKFVYLFGSNGIFDNLPLSERFFLGGETTVRGYEPFKIGPKFVNNTGGPQDEPQGGISSVLFSVEYLQNIYKPVDAFVFFDSGSISDEQFTISHLRMSYGVGLRLEVSPRLPVIVGYGIPINPGSDPVKRFFFSMGGQF